MVVVVLEGQVFVLVVVGFVVMVVGIVQLHKTSNANVFLIAGKMVEKMMKKCAHFEDGLHSLIARRTGRQNLEGKEYGQEFFHFRGKDS